MIAKLSQKSAAVPDNNQSASILCMSNSVSLNVSRVCHF